jgi:hypothetical protein
MDIIDLVEKSAKLSGFEIYDEIEYRRIFNYQAEHGQIEFVEIDGKTAGLFGWLTRESSDGLCVCINNLFILEKYRSQFNIFDMCKFFKNKYPNIYKLEWHNQKKDCFKQLILKGHTI